jgi:hypothetical protein
MIGNMKRNVKGDKREMAAGGMVVAVTDVTAS